MGDRLFFPDIRLYRPEQLQNIRKAAIAKNIEEVKILKKNVTIAFFSPTGNTKKSLEAMAEAAGILKETIDLTVCPDPKPHRFGPDDLVIFGAPVYGGRIPAVARERFLAFTGDHTPCIAVVTYGNRDFDDALLELADLAKEQGFTVNGAAALVGRHTYGEIQTSRPDENDLAQDREFAAKAASRTGDLPEVQIPGNRPYKDGGHGGKFRPLTSEACVKCGLCVKNCPVQAIDKDCRTISDACLSCFRCIRNCPAHAKNMDTEDYRAFASAFTERLKNRRENQYFCNGSAVRQDI